MFRELFRCCDVKKKEAKNEMPTTVETKDREGDRFEQLFAWDTTQMEILREIRRAKKDEDSISLLQYQLLSERMRSNSTLSTNVLQSLL